MFEVIELPYGLNSLSGVFTKENLYFHYEKHHKGYAKKLNELSQTNPRLKRMSLEYIVRTETGEIYNNAAQILNHNFFWKSMTPKPTISNFMLLFMKKYFGSLENFQKQFEKVYMEGFGSYWTWFVLNNNKLEIVNTQNAEQPDGIPLLVCDGWEHAFYPTYFNDKKSFIQNWWKVVNWNFLESNIKEIM